MNCLKREKECTYISIGAGPDNQKYDDASSTPTSSVSPAEPISVAAQAAALTSSPIHFYPVGLERSHTSNSFVSSNGEENRSAVTPLPSESEQGRISSRVSLSPIKHEMVDVSSDNYVNKSSSKIRQEGGYESSSDLLPSDGSIVVSSHKSQEPIQQSLISKLSSRRENWAHDLNLHLPTSIKLTPPPGIVLSQNEYQLLDHYGHRAGRFIMTAGENHVRLWLDYVPTIGFSSPAVLDSLLGVAALDLTRQTHGAYDFNTYARKKFIQCLKNFTSGTNNTPESNFITSCFLMIMAFDLPDLIPLIDENRLDLMEVISGPGIIAENVIQALMNRWVPVLNGHLQPLVEASANQEPREIGSLKYLLNITEALDRENLLQHDKFQFRSSNNSESLCEEKYLGNHRQIYDTAIRLMHDTYAAGVQYNNPIRMFYYLMHCCKDICALARKRYAYALVVMVFMLACLIPVQDFMWVNQRCQLEVRNLVNLLGDEWRDLLAWPISLAASNPDSLSVLTDPRYQIYPRIDVMKLIEASKSGRYVQSKFIGN